MLPGLSGLDFQVELTKADIHIPIVFMTGHGGIPMSVMAMKARAVDFLSKPFRQQEMLDAVTVAIERDRKRRKDEKIVSNAQALFETLPPREREVLFGRCRTHEQTDSSRDRHCRDYREDTPRTYHEENGHRSLADLVRITEILVIRRARP
jgi:FixJ family two-component response regulator